MASKSIYVDHDVSLLGMLRLDDTDNILISRIESIWKYHDMLFGRLTNMDKQDVEIHLRPRLLNADAERYAPYLQEGAQLRLWQSEASPHLRQSDNLMLVHMKQSTMAKPEGFLLIRTPSSSRILAAWPDASNKIVGVLVTNPKSVEKIADQLDAIIQSAARSSLP